MPIHRQLFNINAASSAVGDTGPPINGALLQLHWNPTTADTGADLQIAVLPKTGDTGDGWVVLEDNDCLGTNFTRALRQRLHDSAGASDTGAGPIVMAGDRLRVKVTPGGSACVGRLYVYTLS
jgi:hypothetical protein